VFALAAEVKTPQFLVPTPKYFRSRVCHFQVKKALGIIQGSGHLTPGELLIG
jgi:hypothetical protein